MHQLLMPGINFRKIHVSLTILFKTVSGNMSELLVLEELDLRFLLVKLGAKAQGRLYIFHSCL